MAAASSSETKGAPNGGVWAQLLTSAFQKSKPPDCNIIFVGMVLLFQCILFSLLQGNSNIGKRSLLGCYQQSFAEPEGKILRNSLQFSFLDIFDPDEKERDRCN